MSITNAERIAEMVIQSPNLVKIHTIPNSELWIVMFVTKKSRPNWRCVLCNPNLTTWRLVTENITDDQHQRLYEHLIWAHVNNKFTHYLSTLKKTVALFKSNKNNNTYDPSKLRTISSTSKSSRS